MYVLDHMKLTAESYKMIAELDGMTTESCTIIAKSHEMIPRSDARIVELQISSAESGKKNAES